MRLELSVRADYAVRAMLALASADGSTHPTSVRTISAAMAIPVRFLPHVMADLGRAGLVIGAPGRRGGYRLARPASQITILDVVDAVDPEDLAPRCVLRGGPCRPDGRCAVHDVIAGATQALRTSLSAHSLAEIADGARTGRMALPLRGT